MPGKAIAGAIWCGIYYAAIAIVLVLGFGIYENVIYSPPQTTNEMNVCHKAHMVKCHVEIDSNGDANVYGSKP